MKKYDIGATGIKRLNISRGGGGGGLWGVIRGKASLVAISQRPIMLLIALMLAIILPFLFLRVAFFLLQSASACSSSSLGNLFFFTFLFSSRLVLNFFLNILII